MELIFFGVGRCIRIKFVTPSVNHPGEMASYPANRHLQPSKTITKVDKQGDQTTLFMFNFTGGNRPVLIDDIRSIRNSLL